MSGSEKNDYKNGYESGGSEESFESTKSTLGDHLPATKERGKEGRNRQKSFDSDYDLMNAPIDPDYISSDEEAKNQGKRKQARKVFSWVAKKAQSGPDELRKVNYDPMQMKHLMDPNGVSLANDLDNFFHAGIKQLKITPGATRPFDPKANTAANRKTRAYRFAREGSSESESKDKKGKKDKGPKR